MAFDSAETLGGLMQCYECGRTIGPGESYVTVDYHIERVSAAGGIDVEPAESLLIVCMDCAPSRAAISQALAAAGFAVAPDPEVGGSA